MIKGQDPEHIVRGNSFSEDGHVGKKFDYMLSNPPFGVEWKKVQKEIEDEHQTQGFAGRFGPGLPRINDGSLLCWGSNDFLQLGNVGGGGTTPALVELTDPAIAVAAGPFHTCAITAATETAIYCWGSDGYGQLGDDKGWQVEPVEVPFP